MLRKELNMFTGRKKTIYLLDLQQNHKSAPKKNPKIHIYISKRILYFQKKLLFHFSFIYKIKT